MERPRPKTIEQRLADRELVWLTNEGNEEMTDEGLEMIRGLREVYGETGVICDKPMGEDGPDDDMIGFGIYVDAAMFAELYPDLAILHEARQLLREDHAIDDAVFTPPGAV